MDSGLSGKAAVVTGASKGIGLASNERPSARRGARRRGRSRRNRGTGYARGEFASPSGVCGSDGTRRPNAVGERGDFGGRPDILVNNVGAVRPRLNGFLSITDDDWSSTLAINFFVAVRTTRAALPLMLKRGAGTIVTICSVNSFLPDPLVMDYARRRRWQLLQGIVQRGRSARHPGQHGQPWTRCDWALARK